MFGDRRGHALRYRCGGVTGCGYMCVKNIYVNSRISSVEKDTFRPHILITRVVAQTLIIIVVENIFTFT